MPSSVRTTAPERSALSEIHVRINQAAGELQELFRTRRLGAGRNAGWSEEIRRIERQIDALYERKRAILCSQSAAG